MNLGLMRFLTDENISPKVVAFLRKCGADVLDVKELGWQGRIDNEILERALAEKRVILTCDKDFGTLAVYGLKPHYGIIFIRPGNLKQGNIIRLLGELAEKIKFEEGIIITLADAERNNGHNHFTEAVMYRIASHANDHYWYRYYKINNGLDCGHCSKAQRQTCREEDLYRECPKAIKLESLSKPVLDNEGNLTELGNLIADDKALDLDAWVSTSTWEIGYPKRLVDIAYRLKTGIPLTDKDRQYLCYWRKREQKNLF